MSWNFIEWLLGILGIIFLGALGSGLWTLLLEKPTRKIGGIFFKISTLGINSLRDKLYAEVARPCKERSARFILKVLFFAVLLCCVLVFSIVQHLDPFRQPHGSPQLERIKQVLSNDDSTKEQKQQAVKELEAHWKEARFNLLISSGLFFLLLMSPLLWNYTKLSFIDSYRAYLDQARDICMPYFNPDEYNKLLSDIGQIKSKEDFTRVKQRLEEIASRGEIKLPYIQIN
jgi:hypothetical protein